MVCLAGCKSPARDSSSSGNFASNSTSEIPNALAVALFGAPNAIIARTKRRSASLNFEAPHLSAASASLSACTRGVIAVGFRPDPGLAPPRPIPLDFVISNPSFGDQEIPNPQGDKSNYRTVAKSDSRRRALTPPALRSWAFVASRWAPVRSFAGRHDHKQFKACPGMPRESVSGNP